MSRAERKKLEAARALVANPQTWTTGNMAVDRDGRATGHNSPDAVRFCALGALYRAGARRVPFYEALHELYGADETVSTVNDGPNGRKRILAAFDKALESA